MTDSRPGWLAPDRTHGPRGGRLPRPVALLLIMAVSLSLWMLIAVGVGGI